MQENESPTRQLDVAIQRITKEVERQGFLRKKRVTCVILFGSASNKSLRMSKDGEIFSDIDLILITDSRRSTYESKTFNDSNPFTEKIPNAEVFIFSESKISDLFTEITRQTESLLTEMRDEMLDHQIRGNLDQTQATYNYYLQKLNEIYILPIALDQGTHISGDLSDAITAQIKSQIDQYHESKQKILQISKS